MKRFGQTQYDVIATRRAPRQIAYRFSILTLLLCLNLTSITCAQSSVRQISPAPSVTSRASPAPSGTQQTPLPSVSAPAPNPSKSPRPQADPQPQASPSPQLPPSEFVEGDETISPEASDVSAASGDASDSGNVVGYVIASLVFAGVVMFAAFVSFGFNVPTAPALFTYSAAAGTGGTAEATGVASVPGTTAAVPAGGSPEAAGMV